MITVIVPCYNEEENLPLLFARMTSAAEKWNEPAEIILIDDGSQDRTFELARGLNQHDPRLKVVRFARNFGHQVAVSAGIHYASGDCVVVLDADLQDPPEEIQRLIEKWREGYEVVYAIRERRKGNILKRGCYKLFYRILRILSDTKIPYDSGDFCLMDRKVVDLLKKMPERNRYVRGLRTWVGFRQIGLKYNRDERVAGKAKYTFRKLFQLALNGIFSFSTIPLRVATYLGFAVSLLALLGALFTFCQRIFEDIFAKVGLKPVPGFATTVISILFIGGVQLIFLGILGEYIGRIYDEVKGRPLWIIFDRVGFDSSQDHIKETDSP